MNNVEMLSTDMVMHKNHIYREIKKALNINKFYDFLKYLNSPSGAQGFGNRKLILVNILQFLEGISEREMERKLQENIPTKWFCEFSLSSRTPTYSSLCKFRMDIIKEENISDFYQEIKNQIELSSLDEKLKKKLKLEKKLKIFDK